MSEPPGGVLRATFDQDADRYERARPGYPADLFDDLADLAGTGPGCRVLEIGPGTGQATLPMAQRGYHITAVELGCNLAAVARAKLAGFPQVDVVVSAFESWLLPAEPFDVVVAATAFHWIDPVVGVTKSADALRIGGALAVVETHHVDGGTVGFFRDVQACYERFDPDTQPDLRLPTVDEVAADDARVRTGGRFGPATVRRYQWEAGYTTVEYLDLLLTYSGHRALPEPARTGLLGCIGRLIDDRYGGQITKRYLTQLRLNRRTA